MNLSDSSAVFSELFPFWENLSVADREMLCDASYAVRYSKGQIVHSGRAECTGGILVRTGGLRVMMLSEQGREITLYRLAPGQICMLSASCVLQSVTFDVVVEATEKSDCIVIGGQAFASVTQRYSEAENYALKIAVSRFSEVLWTMQELLFRGLDRRLAAFLADRSDRDGTLRLHMTQAQIARELNTAREVVSRTLKEFSLQGLVRVGRSEVTVLDPEGLRRSAL